MERPPPGALKSAANRLCASVSSFSRRVSTSTRSDISAPTISRSPGQLETSRDSASARDSAFAAARTLREWEKRRRSACNFPRPVFDSPPGPEASPAGPPVMTGGAAGPAAAPGSSLAPACRGFRPGVAVPAAAGTSWAPGAAWRPPALCVSGPDSLGIRLASDAGLPLCVPTAPAVPARPAAVGCVSASFARLPTVVRWFLFFPMAVPTLPRAAQPQVGRRRPCLQESCARIRVSPAMLNVRPSRRKDFRKTPRSSPTRRPRRSIRHSASPLPSAGPSA